MTMASARQSGVDGNAAGVSRGDFLPRLAERIEAVMVRHRNHLVFVHAAMFVLFGGMMAGSALFPAEDGRASALAETALFLVWGLWFPLVFLSVIFSARTWCGVLCPMGAASEWANRIGPRLAIPRWVKWPGTPVVSFVLVTIWAQTAGARDHGQAMAIVFGSTLAAALLLGFLFGRGKRAWCRHMCPIGLLLGVYSRIGMLDFQPKRPRPGGDRWTERTVCPTMIDLKRKTESRHCLACYRCVGPKSKGGLFVRLRPPGEELSNIAAHNPNLSEVLFLFLGTGVSLGGFLWLVLPSYQDLRLALGNWAIDHGWYWIGTPGPRLLMSNYPAEREVFTWLDFGLITSYMLGWAVAVALVMSAATAAAAWICGRFGGKGRFSQRFVELGYQFLPVAMVSLLLGLGGKLFGALSGVAGHEPIAILKAVLLIGGALWSLVIGHKLIGHQLVRGPGRWVALAPGAVATLALGAVWAP
ncbi:MAG: 4Fe-4S binding protein, partial [Alphaproteobacteria bacterium]